MSLREAAQQALEAMQSFESGTNGLYKGEFAEEISALKAALAEPECPHGVTDGNCKECYEANAELVEPVAWRFQSAVGGWAYGSKPPLGKYPAYPLYAAPPQRKPLTEDQMNEAYLHIWRNLPDGFDHTSSGWIEIAIRYAERAHGIK